MTVIHTGNTTTTGFSVTSDVTGRLVVKTGGSGGTTALTVGEDQRVTFASQPIVPVPAFRAYMSADQSVTNSAITKVNIDTKTGDGYFDTNGWFDTTNYRYVPQIAGYYQLNGTLRVGGTSQSLQAVYMYKNGSLYSVGAINRISTSSEMGITISTMVYLNGTTDYVELHGQVGATSPRFDFVNSGVTCVFEGFLVRGA